MGYSKVRHTTERLQDAGLIRGVKEENVWEYFKTKKTFANAAISLKDESLDSKSILNFLEENLPSAKIPSERESVVSKVTNTTPCLMNDFYATFKNEFKEFISDKTSLDACKFDFATSATREKENQDEEDTSTETEYRPIPPQYSQYVQYPQYERVKKDSDLFCCNHSDREAIVKTDDDFAEGKVGLCEECFKENIAHLEDEPKDPEERLEEEHPEYKEFKEKARGNRIEKIKEDYRKCQKCKEIKETTFKLNGEPICPECKNFYVIEGGP